MPRCAEAPTVPQAPPLPRPTAVDVPRRATRHATSGHPGTASGSTTCDPERDPPRLAAPARRPGARQATAGPDAQPQRRGARRVRRRGSEDVDRPAHGGPGPSPSSPVSPRARHRLHECIPVRSFAGGRPTREGGTAGVRVSRTRRAGPCRVRPAPRTAPGPIASSPRDRRVASRSVVTPTDRASTHRPRPAVRRRRPRDELSVRTRGCGARWQRYDGHRVPAAISLRNDFSGRPSQAVAETPRGRPRPGPASR